ncbi:hypothetical protein P9274_20115 [Schinkia azotoformans]|uniref:hypothetical protein n=1 Tax=Schinkia azotoformans TaxID=1454 RepID=UPI002E1E1EBB|nr:hypothetical protein [Schinkia azotoformans]
MNKKIDHTANDINSIIANENIIPEVEQLSKALKKYVELRKIDNSRERVQLIFIIGALLDWSEDEFNRVMNRLNNVLIKASTGIDIDQIINQALAQIDGTNNGKSIKH